MHHWCIKVYKATLALGLLAFGLVAMFAPSLASAQGGGAYLYTGPSTGQFEVGKTFTVSFFVNTGGNFINAVEADIFFPPDKLQVVSPSSGSSFINTWAIQPSYSNGNGTLTFKGAVPSPGINTASGLISTVTFRAKSVGSAIIRFGPNSRVLLNDGLGTDILQRSESAVYKLALPPPQGPIVASETHPDQSNWYQNEDLILTWGGNDSPDGFSYVLNDTPIDIPDNISEGSENMAHYRNLSSGRHYFHVKASNNGVWGGATHFAVSVDSQPPAEFPLNIEPSARTSSKRPVFEFSTTDAESGIEHYEISIIALSAELIAHAQETGGRQPFFVEANSPYLPSELAIGSYEIVVRAYDRAGNYQDSSKHLRIVQAIFAIVQEKGLSVFGVYIVSWPLILLIALIILIILGMHALKFWRKHKGIEKEKEKRELPKHLDKKLVLLKEYQKRYGKLTIFIAFFISLSFIFAPPVLAQELSPPMINNASKDIFNDEVFYISGVVNQPEAEVVVYLQKEEGGETVSAVISPSEKGEWFYQHPSFLNKGSYQAWTQARVGETFSPPSAQILINVDSHALQFGASRLSYEVIYLLLIILFFVITIILSIFIIHHRSQSRKKHALFTEEIRKAEESIQRGFALIRKDIEEEARVIKKAQLQGDLSEEEKAREEELLKDLEEVKTYIGEEIWELEKLEHGQL